MYSMRIYYSDTFVLPLPEGHRFPMSKYSLLRQRVEQAGLGILATPPPASDEELLRVHTPVYLAKVINGTLSEKEQRRIGFPWSPGLVERCDFVVRIPGRFCVNLAVAGAIAMYDRMISLGRFAERPVRAGGPAEPLPDHAHGEPLWKRKRKRGARQAG